MTSKFLQAVDEQVDAPAAMPHVESVESPTRLKLPRARPFERDGVQRPIAELANGLDLAKDLDRIKQRDDVMGTLVSRSGKSVALTIQHSDGLSKAGCDSLAAAIGSWQKQLLQSTLIENIHVAGTCCGASLLRGCQ